jgi:hypothetical protein
VGGTMSDLYNDHKTDFNELSQRFGQYNLAYLIKLIQPGFGMLLFINDTVDAIYESETYKAITFTYTEPEFQDGRYTNASLEIPCRDTDIINLIESTDENFRIEVVGIKRKDSDIVRINKYYHQHGTINYDGGNAQFAIEGDDSMDMIFPPDIFNSFNNRGNA